MCDRFPSASAALVAAALTTIALVPAPAAQVQDETLTCTDEQPHALAPKDPKLCAELAEVICKPGALPLPQYETKLCDFLRNFCHRDEAAGWQHDKRVRGVGPYIATLAYGQWTGEPFGTHAPVVI
jgi:hypothetical protein